MTRILFVGTFLSHVRGTKGVAESIAQNFLIEDIILKLTSKFENKLLRILDIIWTIFKYSGKIVHIDVYSGPAFNIALIASQVAFFRNKEIILTLHGGKLPEFARDNPIRIKKLFSRSKYIQTPSLYLREYFTKMHYVIHYLPNAVDLDKFPFKRSSVMPYSLLWIRGFTSIYNPKLAIQILSELKKVYPKCTLTMVGPDNGLLAETLRLADKLGVRNALNISGPVANEKLYTYYQTHQVYLNTTSYESFGMAVVEAAACGIPIVSANVGEIPFIWEHEKNILLVNNYEAEEFTKPIIRLFEDKKLYGKLSLNGRMKAETFSWEKIKPLWEDLLFDSWEKV